MCKLCCLLITMFIVFAIVLLFSTGCLNPMPTESPGFPGPPAFGPEWLDAIIEIARAVSLANLASTPVNPFVVPIGVGLAGVTAVLEALRRKEKSGRKHAEQKLNGNNNNS